MKRAFGREKVFPVKIPGQKANPKSMGNGSGFRRFGHKDEDRIQKVDPISKVD